MSGLLWIRFSPLEKKQIVVNTPFTVAGFSTHRLVFQARTEGAVFGLAFRAVLPRTAQDDETTAKPNRKIPAQIGVRRHGAFAERRFVAAQRGFQVIFRLPSRLGLESTAVTRRYLYYDGREDVLSR